MPKKVDEELRARAVRLVNDHLGDVLPVRDREVERAERAAATLEHQRDAILQAHYAGAVPLEQLKSEQTRIASELTAASELVGAKGLRRDQLQGPERERTSALRALVLTYLFGSGGRI